MISHIDAYDIARRGVTDKMVAEIALELRASLQSFDFTIPDQGDDPDPEPATTASDESDGPNGNRKRKRKGKRIKVEPDPDPTELTTVGDDDNEKGDEEYAQAFGLASDVAVSRTAAMELHFSRLKGPERMQNLVEASREWTRNTFWTFVCVPAPRGG